MQTQEILNLNRERADRASDALIAFDVNDGDEHTGLIDLLTNAMHLFGPEIVFEAAATAAMHYNTELVDS